MWVARRRCNPSTRDLDNSLASAQWNSFRPLRSRKLSNLSSTWQCFKCSEAFNIVLPSKCISKMNDLSCFNCILQEMVSNHVHSCSPSSDNLPVYQSLPSIGTLICEYSIPVYCIQEDIQLPSPLFFPSCSY